MDYYYYGLAWKALTRTISHHGYLSFRHDQTRLHDHRGLHAPPMP
jgi:hypothetical protein